MLLLLYVSTSSASQTGRDGSCDSIAVLCTVQSPSWTGTIPCIESDEQQCVPEDRGGPTSSSVASRTVRAAMHAVSPLDACATITPANDAKTKVALTMRGGCPFTQKAEHIFAAGYSAMVVVDNRGGTLIPPALGPGSRVGIPVVMIGQKDGEKLLRLQQKNEEREQTFLSIAVSKVGTVAMQSAREAMAASIAEKEEQEKKSFADRRAEAVVHMGFCNLTLTSKLNASQVFYRPLPGLSNNGRKRMSNGLSPDVHVQFAHYQRYHVEQGAVCASENTVAAMTAYQENKVLLCSNGENSQNTSTIVSFTRSPTTDTPGQISDSRVDNVVIALNVVANFSKATFEMNFDREGLVKVERGFLMADGCQFRPPEAAAADDIQKNSIFGRGLILRDRALKLCNRWHDLPVVMHINRDAWNAYHSMESLFSVFTAVVVAGINAEESTIILLDKW